MTPEEAMKNLDSLIATSRLTRQEHIILENSLKLLCEPKEAVKNE
jgi:hypothetical protein